MKNLQYSGGFGLERETLRVDAENHLAQTPHPFGDDSNITRDFCENQLELITPVCHSIDEVIASLGELHQRAEKILAEQGEHIWLYSNPPHFRSEQEIPIAKFSGEQSSKQFYREALEKRYGKRLMLFSGVHFNFSFPEELLRQWQQEEKNQESFENFRDQLYLNLYQQLFVHSYMLVLLTAASPVYDKSLDGDGLSGAADLKYASPRNSERGYWNQFVPVLDYTNLNTFGEGIQEYIRKGLLFSVSELYLPIRLKPRGENSLEALVKNGVDHIELRMFDLNPLCPLGVNRNDLYFAHLLILYLARQEKINLTPGQQEQAVKNHQNAALYHPDQSLIENTRRILADMQVCFSDHSEALSVIEYQKQKLNQQRYCEQIRSEDFY